MIIGLQFHRHLADYKFSVFEKLSTLIKIKVKLIKTFSAFEVNVFSVRQKQKFSRCFIKNTAAQPDDFKSFSIFEGKSET